MAKVLRLEETNCCWIFSWMKHNRPINHVMQDLSDMLNLLVNWYRYLPRDWLNWLLFIALFIEPQNVTVPARSIMSLTKDSIIIKLNLIHFFVFVFSGIVILISVFLGNQNFNVRQFYWHVPHLITYKLIKYPFFFFVLGAQYIFRYHKYQLAKNKEEPESPLNTPPTGSTISITGNAVAGMKAVSTSTIFSEVITLVKLKPKSSTIKHQKLRESVVSQDFEKEHLNDYDSIGEYSK